MEQRDRRTDIQTDETRYRSMPPYKFSGEGIIRPRQHHSVSSSTYRCGSHIRLFEPILNISLRLSWSIPLSQLPLPCENISSHRTFCSFVEWLLLGTDTNAIYFFSSITCRYWYKSYCSLTETTYCEQLPNVLTNSAKRGIILATCSSCSSVEYKPRFTNILIT